MSYTIRSYDPALDLQEVHHLWQQVFEETWPIGIDSFQQVTTGHHDYRSGDHFVAEMNGQIIGFAATQIFRGPPHESPGGGISVVFVAPFASRQRIGTALHMTALEHLQVCGMESALLGGGGLFRFWPGVPTNLPGAVPFFESQGWKFSDVCFDMVCSVENYLAPAGILERFGKANIEFRPAQEEDIPQILALEQSEFSGWHREFCLKIEVGDRDDILVAIDGSQRVVGALLMYTPHSHYLSVNRVWSELLPGQLGGIGSVGVTKTERERGIGVAMVARATEILKERGVSSSLIDWTALESFYSRAGYRRWRDYFFSHRTLNRA